MRRKKNTTIGFSLTETLVYMGVFVFVLAFLTIIFSSMIDQQQEAQTNSAVVQDGKYIMARLMYDISRADQIIIPAVAGGQSDILQIQTGSDIYTYSLAGNKLNLNDGSQDYVLNGFGSNTSSVVFTKLENDSPADLIKVDLDIISNTRRVSGFETRSFQTTVGTR